MDSEVIIYTSDHCKKCESLKRLFNQWGISFKEKNTTKNRSYLKELQQVGIYGTPTTVVDDKFIEGFQENRLFELLKK